MNKKVALVDLDYTVCSWHDGMIPELLKLESPEEIGKYDYSDCWKLEKQWPHIGERIKLVMSKRGFWKGLKPIEAGMQLYYYIQERFKTYILTKARKECDLVWGEKVEWIHKYLGYDTDMMLVTDKEHIKGDLLFDDDTRNAELFLKTNTKGRVIMPIRRHNERLLFENCDERINLWDDGPTKQYISDFGEVMKTDYDFSVPHKVIEEVLAQN